MIGKKCTRSLYLLLGGGLYDSRVKNSTRGLRCTRFANPTVLSKKEIERDKRLYKKDIRFMENHFRNLPGKNQIFRTIPPVEHPDPDKTKQTVQEFLNQYARRYVIYWFGHGDPETGNWCFEKRMISLLEFLEIWKSSMGFRSNSHLILILDTCHSYKWVEEIIRLPENFELGRISIQCGCSGEQESFVDRISPPPRSLLLKKMIWPDKIWGFDRQNPIFWITESALKFSREVEGENTSFWGEIRRIVEPGLHFVTIRTAWRDEKEKVSFYTENNRFVKELLKKKCKDGIIH